MVGRVQRARSSPPVELDAHPSLPLPPVFFLLPLLHLAAMGSVSSSALSTVRFGADTIYVSVSRADGGSIPVSNTPQQHPRRPSGS